MEIRQMGAGLFHADGRTNEKNEVKTNMAKLIVVFAILRRRLTKYDHHLPCFFLLFVIKSPMKGNIKLQTTTFVDNSQADCYEIMYVGRQ